MENCSVLRRNLFLSGNFFFSYAAKQHICKCSCVVSFMSITINIKVYLGLMTTIFKHQPSSKVNSE